MLQDDDDDGGGGGDDDDDYAISGMTWMLVLEFGSQFLKHSTVTVSTDCVDIT